MAQFGDNFLLNGDPTSPLLLRLQLLSHPNGLRVHRPQNRAGPWLEAGQQGLHVPLLEQAKPGEKTSTAISSTSAVDKLNGANHIGDILTLSHESRWGVFRTGIWYDWAYTDRYQYPSSPFNWADVATPNFHEHFITQTYQPFAEYEWRATSKLVDYSRHQGRSLRTCISSSTRTTARRSVAWAASSVKPRPASAACGLHRAQCRLQFVAAFARGALPRAAELVGLRPVWRRQRDSADQCVRCPAGMWRRRRNRRWQRPTR